MKKSIFITLFVIFSLFISFSYVYANDNTMENIKNNLTDTANNAGNVAGDAAKGTAGAVENGMNGVGNAAQNGMNAIGNTAENMVNGVRNAGNDVGNAVNDMDYSATRTAAETDANNSGAMNNMWTWIIVGVIAIAIIALIWFYVSQNNR